MAVYENIMIEGASVPGGSFRNFAGVERKTSDGRIVNAEGKRSFAVFITPEQADDLTAKGWTVKTLPPREEGDEVQPFIQVKVAFGNYPPEVELVKRNEEGKIKTRRKLKENELGLLDGARFANVDLVIRPYNSKIYPTATAYLKAGYFEIELDPIAAKYDETPIYAGDEEEVPYED